jgi:hypothetical protein
MIACTGKPNDKLKIGDKKQVISLGAVDYDAEAGTVTISVLADGQPLANPTEHIRSTIAVGGEEFTSVSSRQPVKMALLVHNKLVAANDHLSSSDDGIFTFAVDATPERIQVFTGLRSRETVYFDGLTKRVLSSEEYYPPIVR